MKIESQLRSCRSTPSTVTKTGKTQAGKFQQALDAVPQEPRDTFTLSSRAPAVEETPAMPDARPVIQDIDAAPEAADAAPASATKILQGDSTEVKLAKLHQALEEADYTGLPFDEIQTDIYKRFNDAFNGNMPSILTFDAGGPERDDIHYRFYKETRDNVWIPMHREFEAETGIRSNGFLPNYWASKEDRAYDEYVSAKYGDLYAKMLGYGDMSIEETEQAILKKYAGKDTPRDFLNMLGELYQSRALASKLTGWGATACVEAVDKQMLKTYFPDHYLGLHGESPCVSASDKM